MVIDEKRIINKGTDLLGHNTHREGHNRLTEPAPLSTPAENHYLLLSGVVCLFPSPDPHLAKSISFLEEKEVCVCVCAGT